MTMPDTPDTPAVPRPRPLEDGRLYLGVADRVLWFRRDHEPWSLVTTLVQFTPEYALIRAEVLDEAGRVRATGYGYEAAATARFPDRFVQGAETHAIGRALAHLGYGTEAALAEWDGHEPVDAPVALPQHPLPTGTAIARDLPTGSLHETAAVRDPAGPSPAAPPEPGSTAPPLAADPADSATRSAPEAPPADLQTLALTVLTLPQVHTKHGRLVTTCKVRYADGEWKAGRWDDDALTQWAQGQQVRVRGYVFPEKRSIVVVDLLSDEEAAQ